MKKFFLIVLLVAAASAAARQKPNYDLASRFSIKRTSKMVFSTSIRPEWF